MVKGMVVAAPKSGSGKTIATLAIMKLLTKKGIKVAPFKIGPDFIDPSHYEYICGVPGRNIDSYMMSDEFLCWNICKGLENRDCAIFEGVMGLFDGYGDEGKGSTAEIAKKFNLPVVLVVDAKGSSQSILPLIYGFINWDKDLVIHGVILNRINSKEHYKILKTKIEQLGVKCLGFLPSEKDLHIGERHLGLKMGFEHEKTLYMGLERAIENLEWEKLYNLIENSGASIKDVVLEKTGNFPIDVYIAKDKAFSFIYREHIDLYEFYGCRIHFFSPLEKEKIEDADLIYFPGGYPELYVKELSENKSLLENIRAHSIIGTYIFGECGGLIYLSDKLFYDNKSYKLTGVFPFQINMGSTLKTLGYVDVIVKKNNPLFEEGSVFKGHRFHYSNISSIDDGTISGIEKGYMLKRKGKVEEEGYIFKNCLASYVHIHFGSNISGFEKVLKKLYERKQKIKGIREFI
jgi:cobyrinic acid a,c-diamide synthase